MVAPPTCCAPGREPVTRGKDVSIAEAARTMGEEGISSLIITDGQAVTSIITDADMRSRVVAAGVDTSRPVADVMTSPVRTIAPNALVFEAMLTMSEMGIHHLPVADDTQVVGVVTAADIMRQLQADPIYLAADVARASQDELEGAYRDAARVAVRFFERGASAAETQRLLTSIADALAKRLGTLAVEKLGPPPVPFTFVAVGSQARGEMGPASDQDNALVLDDSYDAERHGEYYAEFSAFVCEGLARAGQALCPGDMMASSPQWRMTESEWGRTFHGWVTAPNPDALLAALATFREPPVGFFRGFVLERSGDYAHTLDIKRGGTAAVVQMARLYAIAAGVDEVDTIARLGGAAGGPVSAKGAADLLDAYEYLANLAMRHQAKQVRAGDAPNYHIDPKQLPERDRAALRDAFGVIKSLQNALSTVYPTRAV